MGAMCGSVFVAPIRRVPPAMQHQKVAVISSSCEVVISGTHASESSKSARGWGGTYERRTARAPTSARRPINTAAPSRLSAGISERISVAKVESAPSVVPELF
jgi:hypothetical protein